MGDEGKWRELWVEEFALMLRSAREVVEEEEACRICLEVGRVEEEEELLKQ